MERKEGSGERWERRRIGKKNWRGGEEGKVGKWKEKKNDGKESNKVKGRREERERVGKFEKIKERIGKGRTYKRERKKGKGRLGGAMEGWTKGTRKGKGYIRALWKGIAMKGLREREGKGQRGVRKAEGKNVQKKRKSKEKRKTQQRNCESQ